MTGLPHNKAHPDVTWLRKLVRDQRGLDEHGALNVIGEYENALGTSLAREQTQRERAERAEAEVNALVHVYKTGGIEDVLALLAALSARKPGKEAG